ncbi:MAG: hypothetical protein HY671_13185 [Chloroflexi bacterium]|nr:hypothetical protein [Chloroflexota bacterium]
MQRVPISWLHTQAYCEYQIYLQHVLGVKAGPTTEMLRGTAAHHTLEEKHKEAAELALSVDEALQKAQKDVVVLAAREVRVEGALLVGKIDEVQFMPDRVRIIDDKPGFAAFPGNRQQVWGYCLAFEQCYRPALPVFGVLRNRDSGMEFWDGPFLEQQRLDVSNVVTRILSILGGQLQAERTANKNKCKPCRLKAACDAAGR